MSEVKIKLSNVYKSFGKKTVLNGVNLDVCKGESLVVIGGSGTGKSVLIKCIQGLLTPEEGSIKVDDTEVVGIDENGKEALHSKMGMLFQGGALFDSLSVWENVAFDLLENKGYNKKDAKNEAIRVLRSVGLDPEVADLSPAELSGGMQKRVGLARAIISKPEIIFFDEPTTGLDPATRKDVWSVIESLRRNTGMTIFLTTHYMEEAAGANRIIIIDKGSVRAQGTPFELKEKYASDTVKIYCSKENGDKNFQTLSDQGFSVKKEEYGFSFPIKNTVDAIEPVHSLKEQITGFEVIQGNMDDVFLNACSN